MSKKLTPWFPGSVKPVHVGIYMLMDGLGERIGYQHWNGSWWSCWTPSIEDAAIAKFTSAHAECQNYKWRGLAEQPK